ncbi:hypothetical protein [Mesoterricola silvestris]|uniref:DUF3857 domain-containing protein n=1 Tax=Mesoterricola silvestris TaxID=2927979 RepID=A0AA48H4C9_9BACT|nr:hypothetical protein [Mesoterricola silvestris]BDU71643.1 hypothetical protein METEAL_08170 [Mesoterricola silvestris]
MFRFPASALLGLAIAGTLAGAEAEAWKPIPADVWALTDSALPGGLGAINLARRIRVTDSSVVNEFRIRICSQRGRRAAEFTAFEKDAAVTGRVVYPDGRQLTFDSQKDFHVRTSFSSRLVDHQEQVLVPPGLTDDCVVDLRWEAPRYWSAWARVGRGSETWDLASTFPTRILTVEVPQVNWFDFSFNSAGLPCVPINTPDLKVLTIKDVPATTYAPFALKSVRNIPLLKVYIQGNLLRAASREGKDAFWKKVVELYRDFLTKDLVMGNRYRAFSADIRKDLPAGPQALAQELALRIQDKVLNLDRLTLAERSRRTRKESEERIELRDLEGLARRGTAHGGGIFALFLQLLKEAGVTPKVFLVVDREVAVFHSEQKNINQITDFLVGVEEPGKPPIWLDPAMRFAPPTLVHPDYQGTPCIEIDTATWTGRFVDLPSQAPSTNRRRDTYRLELLPDQDRFTLEADFRGYDDYRWKWTFMNLEPREQDRKLREQLEVRLDTIVDKAQVLHATDPRTPIQWTAEGRIDRAVGRHRRVDPFPMTPYALPLPDALSETRSDSIILPYLLEREAVSRFRLPPGYGWKGAPPYRRSNEFGSVSLLAERVDGPDGPEGVATLKVQVVKAMAGPGRWAAFKEFLGWIREAGSTQLILEKNP